MLIRGPFTLTWGGNTLEDIEAVDVEYEVNSDDYESNAGLVYQIDKSIKASVKLTLLATDIASLAAILPQYFVPQNEQLADGNYVFDTRGAIDITADDCTYDPVYNNLEIVSCGNPAESIKLIQARSVVDSFQVGKLRKIVVKFIGEPEPGESIIQVLGEQGDSDFFALGNDELFLLGNGDNLIL